MTIKALAIFFCVASAAFAQDPTSVITKVLKDMDSFNATEFPPDSVVSSHPLGGFAETDFKRRYDFDKKQFEALKTIENATLSLDDQINRDLLLFKFRNDVIEYENKLYHQTILSDEGFHTSLAHRASARYDSKKRLQYYVSLLKDIPRYVDEQIALTRKGLQLGISQPYVALKNFENTYDIHIVSSYEQSLFWKPFTRKPSDATDDEWKKLQEEGKVAVEQSVIPAYRKVKDFFEKEYFVKTRKTLGASSYPNGKKVYADLVKYYTTLDLTPAQVFDIGMREVERIDNEMKSVLQEVGFAGSVKDFINKIRNEDRFYPASGEQLLKEAAFIAKKIDGNLPTLFGKLPRQPYGVEPVPDFLAPTYTAGRYSGAPINSTRAGAYWVNTYNLKSRTLYTLEALTLHEAVPGHHLQIALTQELENLPTFRRNFYVNAFGEGWGLCSEYLGYELGLYQDPYSKFGRLTYEMWRACRLVIDVGIHDREWTREQSVTFLADHSALSLHEVNTEINRYICWPGQALAYKMGEIQIKALREKATKALGQKFDIKKFHDTILSQGTVTMTILEKIVDRYIAQELARK